MMKKISLITILSLLGLSLISSHLFATTRGIRVIAKTGQSLYLYKDYHALVVGVSNYEKWPKLPNAVNDAKEMASRLKELGFEVKLVLDPTSREIKTALSEMVYDMGREENRALLFYYAGHGETETLADKTKMGYIIPRDCPILERDPKGFATHAISMRDIESASMRIHCKHVLMLFDSCFSGSLFALVRAVPDDITEKSALPVRQYITAGREDEQVPDKSMFKRCFLIGLDGDADLTGDGYITGSELGMYLSDKVVNYTHRRQHPQYGKINNPDLDRGDFIFALKAPPKEKEPAVVSPPPQQVSEKPQDELDVFLAKIKVKEEAKKRAKDELVRKFKQLLQDLEKYEKIKASDLNRETKLAAWGVLKRKYPEWADGVEPGDSDTLVNRALAEDSDGSFLKLALAGGIKPTITNSIGMKFAYIPSGSFMMGSPPNEPQSDDDERQHRVTISKPFYLQSTEVTQGQWKKVIGDNPSHFKNCGDDCPVENVSWNDIQEFIRKLNQIEGTNKYRLPTEAEWEYACRAGTSTPFYTGNCISTDQANYDGNNPTPGCPMGEYREKTITVGSSPPNPWGLYDMHGNVYEWCQDWHEKHYPSGHGTDPKGPSSGEYRVFRGGSWHSNAGGCRSADRLRYNPGLRNGGLGFRLAKAL
jgi:formylglycine-generating enzyme required for sulfatase activity